MNALDLLHDLESRGVSLRPNAGKLVVEAPAGVLTPAYREMLTRLKPELLGILRTNIAPDELPPEWHLAWDERAAIMEYDAGLPRERAEALALRDILAQINSERMRRRTLDAGRSGHVR